jgi:predicted transcriptional regulator
VTADDPLTSTPASGLVFVLSGPSGVGKSTLIERLKLDEFPISHCVTATTRPRRQGEQHGVHYYFLDDSAYDALLEAGKFLEHAVVHNLYRYGIPLHSIRDGLRRGQDVILAPDVQGASTVREVHEALGKDSGYTTTLKLMQLMFEKGLVVRNERYRSHLYEARAPKEQTQRQIAGDLMKRAFDGSAKSLVLGALAAQPASNKDLDEIRSLLDELEKRRGKK